MADIAVFHPFLTRMGGGEGVCMELLDALQNKHTITLYSLNDPNIPALNSHFGTDVNRILLGSLGRRKSLLFSGGKTIEKITGQTIKRLQATLSYSILDQREHDIIVSTYNEFGFKPPAIQYIHIPNFGPQFKDGHRGITEQAYDAVCDSIHRRRKSRVSKSTLVANSAWTASVVNDVYGVKPKILYPPVRTEEFKSWEWDNKQDGFVSIGRIEPSKRTHFIIDIIEELFQRGHDVHLHLVGSLSNTDYARQIRRRVANLDMVSLEGRVPRDRLVKLICSHKYGIHGRKYEHFGIAVAELLAGGAIPFVHDSGGQREIVGQSDQITYRDTDEALEKIEAVLECSNPESIRKTLPNAEAAFGRERFRQECQTLIQHTLPEH